MIGLNSFTNGESPPGLDSTSQNVFILICQPKLMRLVTLSTYLAPPHFTFHISLSTMKVPTLVYRVWFRQRSSKNIFTESKSTRERQTVSAPPPSQFQGRRTIQAAIAATRDKPSSRVKQNSKHVNKNRLSAL